MDSCVHYAYEKNIAIRRSELNVQLAEANTQTSWGGLLPSLNGQVTHGYNWGQRIDPFTNQFAAQRVRSNNLGLSTSVNLFSGFQQINTYRQSLINEESNKWNYEKTRNDVALNVASAYLLLLQTRELEIIASNNYQNTERQAVRIKKLVDAGQSAEGTLDQILSQLAADKATHVTAENNAMLAKLSLMMLLQLSDEQMKLFEIVIPETGDVDSMQLIDNPEAVVQAALNNFPEIKSAQTNLVSAELGEQIARGAMAPRLSASYSYGTGYSGAAKVLSGSPDSLSYPIGQVIGSEQIVLSFPQAMYSPDDYTTKSWSTQLKDNLNQSLFFNLTIPIFNGFSVSSNVQRSKIMRQDAELQLQQARQGLSQNVRRAHADALAALAGYNASKASAEAGERAFFWTEKRYEQGVSNFVEYGEARRVLDNAQAELTRNKFDYVFKLKILEFYQGKPISLK